jgi:hypothetical protein
MDKNNRHTGKETDLYALPMNLEKVQIHAPRSIIALDANARNNGLDFISTNENRSA